MDVLKKTLQNLKELLDFWCKRNETEMAQMNSKLQKLQQDRTEQSSQLQALKSLVRRDHF